VTNGSASNLGAGCYQITPNSSGQAGSIFSSSTVNLSQPFSLKARLNFGCKDSDGADGIVFVMTTSNTALGTGGGELGYQGINPSIAVEMDDYQNGNFGDPAGDHFSIISQGSVSHTAASNLAGPINLPNIEDCEDHCFTVSWNPQTQVLTATLDGNSISYTGNIINVLGGNSSVFYGFTSGTGALSNLHTVCVGPPQLTPMSDLDICPGQSANLQADPNGEAWQWAPGPGLNPLNVSNPVAAPLATTTYNVTITYACGNTLTDDVTVNVLPPPSATASNNGPVCVGETLVLSAGGGLSYSWSGPLFFGSNLQNPSIPNADLINAGTYVVTVTDAFGCTATASTTVAVQPTPVAIIVPPSQALCTSSPPLTLQGIPAGGIWGGAANAQGQINPAILGPGQFQVTYTYTDPSGCSDQNTISIVINPQPNPQIAPVGPLCSTSGPLSLTGTPAGGTWGGAANAAGQVSLGALGPGTHPVTYTVSSGPACQGTAVLDLVVLAAGIAVIQPIGPFCPEAGLQTLTATPAGGIWGGAASSQGQLDPAVLGPGTHTVTYSVSLPGTCPAADTLVVQVYNPPTAIISGSGTICEGSGNSVPVNVQATGTAPLVLTVAIDDVAQDPVTIGSGVTTLPGTLAGTYTILSVVNANGCQSAGSGSAQVVVAGAPQVSNFDINCDAANTSYTVSFDITGGDPATYALSGSPGLLSTAPPYSFISDPIVSGAGYSITVNDVNDCNPLVLSGTFSCLCSTSAGTMNNSPISLCAGDTATALHNGNEVLDANDALFFVLHSNNGNSLGTVFATSATPVFTLVPPMSPGITYYISAVAGDDSGSGGVNLADPCLSVSFGTPVVFRALPTAQFSPGSGICQGETASLTISLTGTAPFDLVYSDGSQQFSLENILNGHSLSLSPDQSSTYNILTVTDNNSPACQAASASSADLTVWQPSASSQELSICQGDSIFLEGALQGSTGIYVDSLLTFQGCDSLVTTTLTVNPSDSIFLFDSSCNPAQTGVFVQSLLNQYGCDSIVVLTVVFSSADTTLFFSSTCDPSEAGVFESTFVTSEGCDSIVIATITLLPSVDTAIFTTTCDPANAGVFTTVFPAANGCDSTVVTTVTYHSSDTTYLFSNTCDPALSGVFAEMLSNQYGCDSTVIQTITLLPSDTIQLSSTTCDPGEAGNFTFSYTNQFGCDSIVFESILLLPPDVCGIDFLIAGDTIPCTQASGSLMVEVIQGLSPFTYNWQESSTGATGNGSFSGNAATISGLPGGSYSVTLTAAGGLTATAQAVLVQFFQPELNLTVTSAYGEYDISCYGAADGSVSAVATGGAQPYVYSWSNGQQGGVLNDLVAGTYAVTVTGSYGCTAVAAVSLEAPEELSLAFTVNNLDCFGQNDGLILVEASGGAAPYLFSINKGPWSESGLFSGLTAGAYTIVVQDQNGCEASEILLVNAPVPVDVELGDDVELELGDNAVITALVNFPFDSLSVVDWSPLDSAECPSCLDQPVAPLITTVYSVTVTAANGCSDSDQLTLFVDRRKEIYVPNGFSPNGDGTNDEFMVFARPELVRNIKSFLVLSRWGETVCEYRDFLPNDPAYSWDGRHRGREMNPAVFVWLAEVEFIDGEVVLFKGDVTLVR
jgi:hypothetical protein